MTRRARIALCRPVVLLATALAVGGCAGTSSEPAPAVGAEQLELAPAHARPAAPEAAAALAQIADGGAARRRLAYVNLARVEELAPAISPRLLVGRVLAGVSPARLRGARSAVRVGTATVIRGPGLQTGAVAGRRSGADGLVLGGDARLRATLADARPAVGAIVPAAQGAVQACLGDSAVQTILGPAVIGRDAAIGVGLRAAGDRPAGVQLAICFAPHLIRELHSGRRRIARRFADLDVPAARRPQIAVGELGEREMLSAVVPADAVATRDLLALVDGGRALRLLAGCR